MPERLNESMAGRLERAAPRARRLLGTRVRGLEAGAPGGKESATARVGPPDEEDARNIARQLRRTMAELPAPQGPAGRDLDAEADGIAAELVAHARQVMARLEGGAPASSIEGRDAVAFEAVLHARGRPALNVEGDRIEPITEEKHPGSGFWRVFLNDHEQALVQVASAAGAVVVRDRFGLQPPWVQGTAWLIKPDLVVTNRHVLFPPLGLRLARRMPGATTAARFKSDLEVTIDFAFDDGPPRTIRYSVVDVPFVAAEGDPIDVAVIRVTPPAAGGLPAPPPLELAGSLFDSDNLYVVGHPGRMPEVPEKVLAVFGTPNERKRVSFGELMDPDPASPRDILHDASTIGGYSGGVVMGFQSQEVAALHYFGDPVTGNRAITAPALRAHDVKEFL